MRYLPMKPQPLWSHRCNDFC